MVVTIVSLIFLGASKLFITEVLIEKKNMSGRLLLTHSGLGQINAYGIAFPHHKQLGAYLFHPSKPSFSKARKSVPTREPGNDRLWTGPPDTCLVFGNRELHLRCPSAEI